MSSDVGHGQLSQTPAQDHLLNVLGQHPLGPHPSLPLYFTQPLPLPPFPAQLALSSQAWDSLNTMRSSLLLLILQIGRLRCGGGAMNFLKSQKSAGDGVLVLWIDLGIWLLLARLLL